MTIQEAIQFYKQNIVKYWPAENYKWQAVTHFQKHWNLDAENFAEMLELALSKEGNLLHGGMYYAYGMICNLAKMDPERVRQMFRDLYNEDISLKERFHNFKKSCDEMMPAFREIAVDPNKAKNHYQDLRALCVYLSFKYPEKYYLYKSKMYQGFKKLIDFKETSTEKDFDKRNYDNFAQMCEDVVEEIKKDPELLALQSKALESTKDCYSDTEYHLLAQTIIYVNSKRAEEGDDGEWWPSLSDYDPDLSEKQYYELLIDETVVEKRWLKSLYELYQMPGHLGTCKQLGERFNHPAAYYISHLTTAAEKVLKAVGFEQATAEESAKYWPILFQGKHTSDKSQGAYCYKMREPVQKAMQMMFDEGMFDPEEEPEMYSKETTQFNHNIILYGPPGTGKTYNTVNYAVAIIEGKSIEEVISKPYDDVYALYNEYKAKKQIEFTTFHQSYGYEEFIEGIRPLMDNSEDMGDLQYQIKSGIFKEFCEHAGRPVLKENQNLGLNSNPTIWKVSLEGAGDNPTRSECMEKGHIRIGFDSYGENINDGTVITQGKNVLNAFISRMQVGDIVFSCYSATTIDAIGVVTGEYEWHDEYPEYKRLRKVNWLAKGLRENIVEINAGKVMTLSSTYALNSISFKDAISLIERVAKNAVMVEEKRPNYVFIIDEINRGNISKIFGELITLIEDTKRAGADEPMEVMLPYSREKFSVPKNVYILGTMNTADRSIALMDTALRRRFEFEEMMPDYEVMRKNNWDKVFYDDEELDVAKMLEIMNKRIEYLYDREHTIGHAFFKKLKESPTLETLAGIFEKRIIPLLQEYFYEDYKKIQLVLGDNGKTDKGIQFIQDEPILPDDIFNKDPEIDLPEKGYKINHGAFLNIQSYKQIG